MRVIPAIDLLGGRCVRLFKGDYAMEKVYDDDPASRARFWEEGGADLIHVVDLDGARDGFRKNMNSIVAIRRAVSCRIEVGGGVRSLEDARARLDEGIDMVVIGTGAQRNKLLVESLANLYPGRIILGADAKKDRLAVEGWQSVSADNVYSFAASFNTLPLAGVIYTDVDTDGTLSGPNIPAQRTMGESISCPLIASGGISSLNDLRALATAGIPHLAGVIVGTALYEGRFSLPEAIQAVRDAC